MLVDRLKVVAMGFVAAVVGVVVLVGASAAGAARRPSATIEGHADSVKVFEAAAIGIDSWIKGIVVDGSGKPVGGAKVTCRRQNRSRFATSNSNGTFMISREETTLRDVCLQAVADNGDASGRVSVRRRQERPGRPAALARIVLKPARNVLISVLDSRSRPVAAATVFMLDVGFVADQGRTDARGLATLRAPLDATIHWIAGHKPGVGFDYFENYPEKPIVKSGQGFDIFEPYPRGRSAGQQCLIELIWSWTVRAHGPRSRGRCGGSSGAGNRAHAGVRLLEAQSVVHEILRFACEGSHRTAHGIATFDWLPAEIGAMIDFGIATPGCCSSDSAQARLPPSER